MSIKTIYDQLRAVGMTAEGACGLMGNMQAESSMQANIAQRGMTTLTDYGYTVAADMRTIDFVHDSVGYGLCQWTYWSRKQDLLAFADASGVSVGDEDMQVQFCVKELREDFPGVWAVLTSSHDLYECARIVCVQYERPAVNNVDVRYRYARDFFAQLAGQSADPDPPPDPHPVASRVDFTVAVIQFLMQFNDQSIWPYEIDGIKSKKFFDALREFTDAMEGC